MSDDLSGRRFGRLVVERMAAHRARCKCDCGSIKIVVQSALLNGRAVSCGCLSRKRSGIDVPRQSSERGTRGAASSAARQSLEQAWDDAVASAERALAPIRARVRWADD